MVLPVTAINSEFALLLLDKSSGVKTTIFPLATKWQWPHGARAQKARVPLSVTKDRTQVLEQFEENFG